MLTALALCAFGWAPMAVPTERPTVVLWNDTGQVHGWATVCAGEKVLHRYPVDFICGYVHAWGGVAVLTGDRLGCVNAAGYKPVMRAGWIIHGFDFGQADVAVSGSGEFLAEFINDDAQLYVWSLKRKKLVLRVGVRQLRLQGLHVPRASVLGPRVLFAPSGRTVYATFPLPLKPGFDMAEERTVEVSVSTGKARFVGNGEPVGFDGDRLIRANWDTYTFIGSGLNLDAARAHFSSIGDRFVVASQNENVSGRVHVALRSFPKGRLVEKYTVSGLPSDYVLLDACAMPGAVSGQGSDRKLKGRGCHGHYPGTKMRHFPEPWRHGP